MTKAYLGSDQPRPDREPTRRQGISGEPITRDITGEEVYATIYAFEESPIEKGVLWSGANDGPSHVSRDDGKTWTEGDAEGTCRPAVACSKLNRRRTARDRPISPSTATCSATGRHTSIAPTTTADMDAADRRPQRHPGRDAGPRRPRRPRP